MHSEVLFHLENILKNYFVLPSRHGSLCLGILSSIHCFWDYNISPCFWHDFYCGMPSWGICSWKHSKDFFFSFIEFIIIIWRFSRMILERCWQDLLIQFTSITWNSPLGTKHSGIFLFHNKANRCGRDNKYDLLTFLGKSSSQPVLWSDSPLMAVQ